MSLYGKNYFAFLTIYYKFRQKYETKNEINKYIKEENMKKVKGLAKTISEEMEETVKEILERIYKIVNEDDLLLSIDLMHEHYSVTSKVFSLNDFRASVKKVTQNQNLHKFILLSLIWAPQIYQ